ncbi:hypothetical protein Syun_006643 [Stephania yunnanensis]|uniref:Uncharacterized protein n=1 Tax=Stephania yunnanensis TaxID=152371 RepID=A0AAP0KWX3_9MAGN
MVFGTLKLKLNEEVMPLLQISEHQGDCHRGSAAGLPISRWDSARIVPYLSEVCSPGDVGTRIIPRILVLERVFKSPWLTTDIFEMPPTMT